MNKLLLLIPLLISLAACGGSGGTTEGEKPDPTLTPEPIPNPTPTPEPEPEVVKDTAEITSNDEFEFKTSWEMSVEISISQGTNGMVSICSGYTDNGDGTYDIDYSTCSIQATLDDQGSLISKLNITNEVESLIGVVWPMDQSDPLYQKFTISNGQETLTWN